MRVEPYQNLTFFENITTRFKTSDEWAEKGAYNHVAVKESHNYRATSPFCRRFHVSSQLHSR